MRGEMRGEAGIDPGEIQVPEMIPLSQGLRARRRRRQGRVHEDGVGAVRESAAAATAKGPAAAVAVSA
jgi:hypothetical protein